MLVIFWRRELFNGANGCLAVPIGICEVMIASSVETGIELGFSGCLSFLNSFLLGRYVKQLLSMGLSR